VVIQPQVLLEFLQAGLDGTWLEILAVDDGIVLLYACIHDFGQLLPIVFCRLYGHRKSFLAFQLF